MQFKEWIMLFENQKVSDFLRTVDKDLVKSTKSLIRTYLSNVVARRNLDTVINYFTYLYVSENRTPESISNQIALDWGEFSAYITAAFNSNKKQDFVLGISRNDLNLKNAQYHHALSLGNRSFRKGPKGLVIVDVSEALQRLNLNLGKNYNPLIWKGWNWVSLGCAESSKEASAAGHCGNEGGRAGENIVSLRDSKNQVHLTFIVNTNDGSLGESKAVDNNKPNKSYHPAIVSLLLSNYVRTIKGGGYKPEANFHLDDLDPKAKEIVQSKLSGENELKVPENYRKLEWLYQFNIDDIKRMSSSQRLEFLEEVLKVFGNHSPLKSHEYKYDDDTGESDYVLRKNWSKPEPLKFHLNDLAKIALNDVKSSKDVLEVLKKLQNVMWASQGVNRDDYSIWFPDATEEDFDAGIDLPKEKTFNIEQSTIKRWAKKAIDLSDGSSLRDKSTLIDELKDIGWREEEGDATTPYKVLPNIFQNQIDKLQKEILESVLKQGKFYSSAVAGNVAELAYNSLGRNGKKLKSLINFVKPTNDLKKFMFTVRVYHYLEKTQTSDLRRRIQSMSPKTKSLLVSKGYSHFVGKIKDGFAEENKTTYFQKTLESLIENDIKAYVASVLRQRKAIFVDKEDFVVFEDALDVVNHMLNKKVTLNVEKFNKEIQLLTAKRYQKISNKLDRFIINNIDDIVDRVSSKKNKARVIPRHRHSNNFGSFQEYVFLQDS